MAVQINPVLLFSINFCTLTFCQESFLSARLLQPQNDIISEDNDSNQNKTNKNTTFPSQHQTQYMKSRKGSCCSMKPGLFILSQAALIFWLDLTDLLQEGWRFHIFAHPYLSTLMSIFNHLWFRSNRPSSCLPVLNFCVTPALTSPAHHLKIHLIIHRLGADTPTKERYSSAVSGGEERPLGCVEEGTDGKWRM